MKNSIIILFFGLIYTVAFGQKNKNNYWNNKLKISSFRLPPPPVGYQPEYIDLNGDGKPDAIMSVTANNVPVLWLDNDGSMNHGDLEGNTVNGCLLIDGNKDGKYGSWGDLIINWVDTDGDGKSDMQIILEYPDSVPEKLWPNGHYMIVLDTDHDQIFNYIDWNTLKLNNWDHSGLSDFFTDYSGKSAFLKIHAYSSALDDLRLNWENPFLFYDPDDDGLSEMTIRFCDNPEYYNGIVDGKITQRAKLTGRINWAAISIDMDNDNCPGNEFDFDMAISFQGKGFNYMDQVHPIKNLRGLPEADKFFMDPRYRQLTELIYPDHDSAWDLIFKLGEWNRVNFIFDEDDDCNRWERVEFYDPRDPFKIGWNAGGIDNNKQSDATGDRGEWDMDNSGGGKLYMSKFDGRMHLYGAEWGCWRIDQNTEYYQGWDRMWMGLDKNPKNYATVRYTDKDNNGFFDCIEYDMDGDFEFETVIDLKSLGIDDRCELINTSELKYADFTVIMSKMAENMWENALKSVKVAEKYKLNTTWYAKWKQAASIREKYHKGYWLQFYLYKDLEYQFLRNGNKQLLEQLTKSYYSGNWDLMLETR